MDPYQFLELIIRVLLLLSLILLAAPLALKMIKLRKEGINPRGSTEGAKRIEVVFSLTASLALIITISLYVVSPELSSSLIELPFLDQGLLKVVGIPVLFLYFIIYLLSFTDLGDSFRISLPVSTEKTELQTGGIYSYTRNPMVLSIYLYCLASLLLIGNLLAVICLAINIISYHQKVLYEEKFLEQRFGQPYIDYKKSVSRYMPGII